MSTISDDHPTAQIPGDNSQICDTKVSCAQCTNAMNDKLATHKKQQITYYFLAILIAITGGLLASRALSTLLFKNTYYISPKDCFTTGRGLEMAVVGKRANAVLHAVDVSEKGYNLMEMVVCKLLSESSKKKVDYNVKKVMENQYEISYQATSRGRHQLHIKVEGEHIKGSPFTINVIRQFGVPEIISSFNHMYSIIINHQQERIVVGIQGKIIVLDFHRNRKEFGFLGSGTGQFKIPCDFAVDSDGNLLITDCENHHIQKYKLNGNYIYVTQKGAKGTGNFEFNHPYGIAIHPKNGMVYVTETNNNRIQVLNQNLTFHKIFGTRGSGKGQFYEPEGITFDSTGNMYVVDSKNHRIQVLTAEGEFIRQIGKEGEREGELKFPRAIIIDNNDVVYVSEWTNQCVSLFITEGKFLTSIADKEMPPNKFFHPFGVAVDNKGVIYVADWLAGIKWF